MADGSIDHHSYQLRDRISIWSTYSLKRIKLKGGAEEDALTPARKYYVYLTNSKVVKSIKRGYNKRFRKSGKQEIKDEC